MFVVVTSTSSSTQALIDSLSRTFHVPHIIISEPTSLVAKFALPAHTNLLLLPEYSKLLNAENEKKNSKNVGDKRPSESPKEAPLNPAMFELPSSFTPSQLISSSSSSFSSPFSLYLRPRFEAAYFDLFNHLKWDRFFYLYDSPQGLLKKL